MNITTKNKFFVISVLTVALGAVSKAGADEYKSTQTTTTTTDPTNTAKNKDHNVAPVADDQTRGTNSDVEVTRLIRKEIMKNKALSTNAKNVKIVTLNGAVTLRGPVNSQEEENVVTEAAKMHAGSNTVTNELEVKAKN